MVLSFRPFNSSDVSRDADFWSNVVLLRSFFGIYQFLILIVIFRQSVDELVPRASRGSIQARTRDLSRGRMPLRRLSHRRPRSPVGDLLQWRRPVCFICMPREQDKCSIFQFEEYRTHHCQFDHGRCNFVEWLVAVTINCAIISWILVLDQLTHQFVKYSWTNEYISFISMKQS